MPNNELQLHAEDFGFDFSSVYINQFSNSQFFNCSSGATDSSDASSPGTASINLETASIEEMADDFKNVTNQALNSLCNAEDDASGFTAAEILERTHRVPFNAAIRLQKPAIRESDDQTAVERILEEVLERAELAVDRGIIWAAALDNQVWKPLQTDTQISHFLHSLGIRRYGNWIRWFANRVSGDPSYAVPGFFENVDLWGKVSFADGLLDVKSGHLAERSSADRVTAVLRWHYGEIECPPHYERLEEAMRCLAGTDEAYLRLQELCGVALHAEPSGRILYFQHDNPRIASVFTKLIGKTWSDNAVSFLGMRDHERSFRTAQVLEHPIVISGKEGESTLRDISTVLALVDGDGINTDRKNQDPFDFVSRCSMICAGRNLPSLQKSSMQTLRHYLIRVNLSGDLPDYISIRELCSYSKAFTVWSLEGLQRYIENGGHFTYDAGSNITREEASILNFVKEQIRQDPSGKVPASALHDAYANFCLRNHMQPLPKPRLVSYLRDTYHVESRTIRVPWFNEGRPTFGYVGISFSEAYPSMYSEITANLENPNIHLHPLESDEDGSDHPFWNDEWKPDFVHSNELSM